MRILLYSYCKIFQISPNEAKDTPVDLLLDMVMIHGEAEKLKSEEMDKITRQVKHG